MKRILLILAWAFCLYSTAALLRPQLVAVYSVSPSDSLPDALVSWCAVLVLWWLWVRCAVNLEGVKDGFGRLPTLLVYAVAIGIVLWGMSLGMHSIRSF